MVDLVVEWASDNDNRLAIISQYDRRRTTVQTRNRGQVILFSTTWQQSVPKGLDQYPLRPIRPGNTGMAQNGRL
jgi:hypothetical protein